MRIAVYYFYVRFEGCEEGRCLLLRGYVQPGERVNVLGIFHRFGRGVSEGEDDDVDHRERIGEISPARLEHVWDWESWDHVRKRDRYERRGFRSLVKSPVDEGVQAAPVHLSL